MSFPIVYQKSFCWPVDRRNQKRLAENFIRMAVDRLIEVQARDIHADDNRITFSVAMFRWVSNWNLLTNVSSGSIEVSAADSETLCVTFELNLSRLFVSFGLIVVVSAVWSLAAKMRLDALLPAVVFTAVAFLNYGIITSRFSRFVRKIFDRAVAEISSASE